MRESKPLILPLLTGLLLLVPAALALSGSPFEGADGDLTSGAGSDWDAFLASGDLQVGYDEPTGQTDDSLRGKEDEAVPGVDFGSIPGNKSDLLRFYVAHERRDVGGADEDFLYLGWVRANTLGTANMDFEFNQSEVLTGNGRTVERTPGDMLITFAFASGGNQVILGLSRWTETGPCEASSTVPCWGPIAPLSGVAEGAVNTVEVPDPVDGTVLPALTFGEASINLTDAGVFDSEECVSFGSAYVKSRSSDSFTAALKDFIRPTDVRVTNCATITVRKDAVPDDPQDFHFTSSPELGAPEFVLDDDGDDGNGLASAKSFVGRFDGTFQVEETPVPGWDLDDVVCTQGGVPSRDATGAATGQVEIATKPGDEVTCTYTNVKRGGIRVLQVTDPADDPQSFDFLFGGGPDDASQGFSLASGSAPFQSGPVRPGVYAISQSDAGEEWDLASATCDDGSPAGAVDLSPGELVTCTFLNVKRGRIVVDEITDPAGDPRSFDFTVTGGPEGLADAFPLADLSAPRSTALVRPGAYVVEQAPAGDGWDLVEAACDDGSHPATLALDPGEVVTCTFRNVKRGRILVDQVVVPAGDPNAFSFSLSGGPDGVSEAFELTDDAAPYDGGARKPGTYRVAQAGAGEAWDLTDAACSDGSPPDAVSLSAGETVTCTFTNVKRGRIVVDQVSVPSGDPQIFQFALDGGPDLLHRTFGLSDASAPFDSGFVRNGQYAVSQEDPGILWDRTGAVCSDGSPVDAVSLEPGETVTCTFTDVKRGRIVVDQVSVPSGDPQEFSFNLTGGPDAVYLPFALADLTAPFDSGPSRAGTYAVAQSDPGAEWDLTGASCSDGSPVGAVQLDPGETVTCTFTETKRGKIRVDVVSVPAGDPQSFAFSLSGGPDSVSVGFSLTDASAPYGSPPLRAGTYAVAQGDAGEAWDLTGALCSDGSPAGAVALDPGELVVCTFTNVKRGRILVDAVTTPAGDPASFAFSLSGGPDDVLQQFSLADSSAAHDSGFLRNGGYGIEAGDAGPAWRLTSSTCSDGSPVNAVALDPGEIVTCTFQYTKLARVIVVKQAIPDDPQDFEFSLQSPESSETFLLDDDGEATNDAAQDMLPDRRLFLVLDGTSTVVESDPGPAWEATGISCVSSLGSVSATANLATRTAVVQTRPGEDVTCTFTDTKKGRVVVHKVVTDPANPGGSFDPWQQPFDFSPSWGSGFTLRHGESRESPYLSANRSYSVQEAPVRAWVVSSECLFPDGRVQSGGSSISVSLVPGEEVDCTFYNTMRIHPGSAGFWRNWRNHYREAEFRSILDGSLRGSPVFATLFDLRTDVLRGDAVAIVDQIFGAGGGTEEQKFLREFTTTMLNLGVSTSADPAVRALQNNDDICRDCRLLLGGQPAVEQLIRDRAPCENAVDLRIGDAVDVSESTWTGDLVAGRWTFGGLTDTQHGWMTGVFGDINQGRNLQADPDTYPDDPGCLKVPGATTATWYADGDGDGHGLLAERTQTCGDQAPEGYADRYGDCDDTHAAVYPGASELCDGLANDCFDPGYPAVRDSEADGDADGVRLCAGDCDDADPRVYPGAAQFCDGVNNDCSDPSWPAVPSSESDGDGDGYRVCAGDCADSDPARHPGSLESCNGVDDDCNGMVDDDLYGVDSDGDGVRNVCDICPNSPDKGQADGDLDGVGDACDNCAFLANADQADGDLDGIGDLCDTCASAYDPFQEDVDLDGVGDACDNCVLLPNESQHDLDSDGEGDRCDLNDGLILLWSKGRHTVEWQAESGTSLWNVYRGDLEVLKATGVYAQAPGSNEEVWRGCNLTNANVTLLRTPVPGKTAFFLVTSRSGVFESSLGEDSTGTERPNHNPCP